VTGGIGWINDPNGFSVYKGEYHLFFQYHPYSIEWGPMHWGHVKTKDFIRWERLPVAIAPDQEFDKDGCFSGSAVEMPDGRQLLMYTGVYRVRREDGVMQEIQHQCVAVGDGVDYEKYDGNPILDATDLPEGASILDFRDPKIWRDGDTYYAVVGNRPADGSGSILLYESKDGFHWSYDGIVDACYNEYGKMWECPDFFPLDGKQLLIVSPQEMLPIGLEFHAGYGTVCLMGDYNKETHSFDRQRVQSIDYGIDFYAPQTLETTDGRRVMIAWMQNWTTSNCKSKNARFFGEMTLPRELTLRDGKLIQNPVRELANYHGRRVAYENVRVTSETHLHGISGRILDMTVSVRPANAGGYQRFKINIAKDGEHVTTVRYRPEYGTVRVDRTQCGFPYDIVNVREFMVRPRGGEIKLRLVMDRHSLELFVNDGEQAATFILYTPQAADSISFEADGAVLMDVEKYDLNF
jgi:beta-fructofuranosidase